MRVDLAPIFPVGEHEVVTGLDTATPLTRPTGADRVLLQADDKDVRYTLDGSTPDASTGFLLKAGDPPLLVQVPNEVTVTVIEVAASASLQVQWGE